MNDRAFIDTNVFIYLYSEDESEKQNTSQIFVDKYNCIISTQVLNEFCNVCIKIRNTAIHAFNCVKYKRKINMKKCRNTVANTQKREF